MPNRFYRYMVFKDPSWDYKTFHPNFESDVDRADAPQNHVVNATSPDIRAYARHGGKLLLLGCWNTRRVPRDIDSDLWIGNQKARLF